MEAMGIWVLESLGFEAMGKIGVAGVRGYGLGAGGYRGMGGM